jgi:hypothetical protein
LKEEKETRFFHLPMCLPIKIEQTILFTREFSFSTNFTYERTFIGVGTLFNRDFVHLAVLSKLCL